MKGPVETNSSTLEKRAWTRDEINSKGNNDSNNKKRKILNKKHLPLSKLQQLHTLSSSEFCSLLCAPVEMGGAGLSETDVKPIFTNNYSGTSLNLIVAYYMREKDVHLLSQIVAELLLDQHSHPLACSYQVSLWVDVLFKTKLYHLWPCEQLAQQMVSLGLTLEQARDFVSPNFDGAKANSFFNMVQHVGLEQVMKKFSFKDEQFNHCQLLVNWISTLTLEIVPVFEDIEEIKQQQHEELTEDKVLRPGDSLQNM